MKDHEGGTQGTRGSIRRVRPRVICHMSASVDGRIVTDGWPLSPEGRRQYEMVHAAYGANAWLCGRVTMERHFAAAVRSQAQIARTHNGTPREDFVAPGDHDSVAFAVDPLCSSPPSRTVVPAHRRSST